ncbi:ABC transporter permease [Micrococcaceae bacterium Sec5.1]
MQKPARSSSPRLARILLIVAAVLIAAWMIVPTLVIIPLSFSSSQASFQFPPPGWSLDLYRNLATGEWRDAALNSIKIAAVVTVLTTVLGTAAALGLDRSKFPGKGLITGSMFAPLIVPTSILAIGIYAVFLNWKLNGTFLGFVAAHSVVALPMVLVSVSSSLRVFDRNQENAAASLGAGPLTTFMSVTLPQIRSGVVTGAVLAFLASFDEVVVSLFLASPRLQTLPVLMFSSMRRELDPTVAAAATVVFALAAIAIPIVALIQTRNHHVR